MNTQDQILARLAYLKAELDALTKLVELSSFGTAPVEAAPAPAASAAPAPVEAPAAPAPAPAAKAAPAAPAKKVRWRYVSGTWYRIVGKNPFRDGNNYNLFEYLAHQYGDQPFSREQLGEAIATLAKNQKIQTVQEEATFVMVFLRTAGAAKGRIVMSEAPAGGPVKPASAPEAALPPEPGEVSWKLVGKPRFHKGSINDSLWSALDGKTFSRDGLAEIAESLKAEGTLDSARSGEIIARDFLTTVTQRGLAERA